MKSILLKTSKILLVLVLFLVLGVFIYFKAVKISRQRLFKKVDATVSQNFDLIQLENAHLEEQKISKYDCHYDYKVRSKRCHARYTNYYVSNADPVEEFMRVENYLLNLGWKHQYEASAKSKEQLVHLAEKGFLPSSLYKKDAEYEIELHLDFYGERDYALDYKGNKAIELLNKYEDSYSSIYSISVFSDIVH